MPSSRSWVVKKRLRLRFVASTILMIASGFSFFTYALVMLSSLVKGDIESTGMFTQEYIDPKVAVSPQSAFYAEKEALPLSRTVGRVCSEFVMCYPPGIPILAPGEEITEEILQYIIYAKEKGCSMTGPEDAGQGSPEQIPCRNPEDQ